METYANKAEKVVIDELKAIYVTIPKTGCTTIKHMFSKIYGWDIVGNVHNPQSEIYNYIINCSITGEFYKKYYKFAFVRDPFSRLYSAFKSKVIPGIVYEQWIDGVEKCMYNLGVRKENTFKEFSHIVLAYPDNIVDPHIKSQYQFVYNSSNACMVDKIYKFEEFEKSIQTIFRKLKLTQQLALPHKNRTQASIYEYKKYYDNELMSLVSQRYKEDFQLFGYDNVINDED